MKGGHRGGKAELGDFADVFTGDDEEDPRTMSGELVSCVVETMNFLGMAENVERFLRLLEQAQVCTLDEIAQLQPEECARLQVPYDLVFALQKRLRVWALEMVDDAEKELDMGEKHYAVNLSPVPG